MTREFINACTLRCGTERESDRFSNVVYSMRHPRHANVNFFIQDSCIFSPSAHQHTLGNRHQTTHTRHHTRRVVRCKSNARDIFTTDSLHAPSNTLTPCCTITPLSLSARPHTTHTQNTTHRSKKGGSGKQSQAALIFGTHLIFDSSSQHLIPKHHHTILCS